MAEDAVVRVRGASFGPRGRTILSGVELELHAGDVVAIVGANGSGKTTLLRGLVGLDPPRAGTVEVPPGPLGWVPQRDALDPLYPATAIEVVEMAAVARRSRLGALRAEDRRAASDKLECVGLAGLGRTQFAALSGGQRQRVLVARALLTDAPVLALDEPTSGADAESEDAIFGLLADEARKRRRLVLAVVHRPDALARHTDLALVVRHGRVRQTSLAAELRGDAPS